MVKVTGSVPICCFSCYSMHPNICKLFLSERLNQMVYANRYYLCPKTCKSPKVECTTSRKYIFRNTLPIIHYHDVTQHKTFGYWLLLACEVIRVSIFKFTWQYRTKWKRIELIQEKTTVITHYSSLLPGRLLYHHCSYSIFTNKTPKTSPIRVL